MSLFKLFKGYLKLFLKKINKKNSVRMLIEYYFLQIIGSYLKIQNITLVIVFQLEYIYSLQVCAKLK